MVEWLLIAQSEPLVTSKLWLGVISFISTAVVLLITKGFEAWVKSKEHNAALRAKQLELEAEQKTKALEAELTRLAREQEWKRQDEVARRVEATMKQAEVAAELLAQRQKLDSEKTAKAAELLLASNERVAKNSGEVKDRLDVIHTWVNAKMTETMQDSLDAKEQALVLLLEMVDFKRLNGHEPTAETLGRVKAMTARIAELKGQLAERLKQQAKIDAKPVSQLT